MSQIVTALTGQCCIEERCSPLECQLAKHNPIPSTPFSAPYLHPPATCPGGKEWQDCGTLCPLTCDNYNFTSSCPDQCVPGCFCPEGTVDFNGVCVDPSICPGRSIVPSLTSSMSSLTFFPLHLQYQNPLYFQDLASEWLEKKKKTCRRECFAFLPNSPSFYPLSSCLSLLCSSHIVHPLPRQWRSPCGDMPYRCTSHDEYYQFLLGPQPGCPVYENSTSLLPPGQCVLSNNTCQFSSDAPTCATWISYCSLPYQCGTQEELDSLPTAQTNCPLMLDIPPPGTACEPIDGQCQWYNPCRKWRQHCRYCMHGISVGF